MNLNAPQLDFNSPAMNFNLTGGQGLTSGLLTKTQTILDGYSSQSTNWSAISSEFTGSGNIGLNVQTLTHVLLDEVGGNVEAMQLTNAGFEASVTYTYNNITSNPVPEPASVALAGVGVWCGCAASGGEPVGFP